MGFTPPVLQKLGFDKTGASVTVSGGLVPKGAYNAGTSYSVGDSVDYNGSSYVLFSAVAAGTVPTNTTYWQILTLKGAAGYTPVKGVDYFDGSPGSPGADGLTTSVNGITQVAGAITLTQDDIGDGTTYKQYSGTEKSKLAGLTQYTDALAVSAITANAAWHATNWDTAYGWGNHAGLYDTVGAAAAVTPTTLGLVIGTNVLAQRTFGSAANNNTGDFATSTQGGKADTALQSLSGAVLTDQTIGQTIGLTGARLTKLWATDITVTNAIAGSVTGNAGTVTGLSVTAGQTLTVTTGGTVGSAAYTDSTAYDVAGAAAAVTPTTLGLVIGTNVLAQRTFGTAANNATGDFLLAGATAVDSAMLGGALPAAYALVGQTMYIGTTSVAINRASAALVLTGIASIDGSAASVAASGITGTTLASNVLASSLTSVGTLTALTVNNTAAPTLLQGYSKAAATANQYNGSLLLGSNASWYGLIDYSQAGLTTMTFKNGYNNAGALMNFEMVAGVAMTIKGLNIGMAGTAISPGARLEIDGAASAKTLLLKAHATTPGNILELQDSSANVLASMKLPTAASPTVATFSPTAVDPAANVGMVAVAPAYVLTVDRAFIVSGMTVQPTYDPSGHTLAAGNGLRGSAAANGATGTVTALNGLSFAVVNSGANSVGAAAGVSLDAFVSSGGGATTSYAGFKMANAVLTSGTLGTQIGLDIPNLSGATTNLSLKIGTAPSTFAGDVTFSGKTIIATATPASAGATGTTGQVAWDASYIYVCTASNTWKRAGIATW